MSSIIRFAGWTFVGLQPKLIGPPKGSIFHTEVLMADIQSEIQRILGLPQAPGPGVGLIWGDGIDRRPTINNIANPNYNLFVATPQPYEAPEEIYEGPFVPFVPTKKPAVPTAIPSPIPGPIHGGPDYGNNHSHGESNRATIGMVNTQIQRLRYQLRR